jgi:sporulation protein YlmC with PRC-barrel domain
MNKLAIAAAIAAATLTGAAYAQQTTTTGVGSPTQAQVLIAIPQASTSVTGFYQHNVYDSANLDAKIGQIKDVLLDKDGRIGAFIIGVGDFIGVDRKDRNTTVAAPFIDEKNVAVPFDAVHVTQRGGERWLTMNVTRDALKSAPGYKYDKGKASWVPA